MRKLFRRVRATWRRVFPRGSSYADDLATQQREARAPTVGGPGGP